MFILLTPSKSNLLSIGKAAQEAGVSRQSVQYYLMVGLLRPTQTTDSGRRLFDQDAIERIRLIRQMNQTGYTLRDIRQMFIKRDKLKKGKLL